MNRRRALIGMGSGLPSGLASAFSAALLLGGLLWTAPAGAVGDLQVLALFEGRALVRAGAGETLLKVGETSPDGITLLAADAHGARVRYRGEVQQLALSRHVTSNFRAAERQRVAINADALGQYRIRGSVNGTFVDFLVDTGASVVAMSRLHARAIGLSLDGAEQGRVQTAQGTAASHFLTLSEVVVGGIAAHNVRAAVIDADYPLEILLGMSFLRSVALEEQDGVMTLRQK